MNPCTTYRAAQLVFCDYRALLKKDPGEARARLEALLADPTALELYRQFLVNLAGEGPVPRPFAVTDDLRHRVLTRGCSPSALTDNEMLHLLRDPDALDELQLAIFSEPNCPIYKKMSCSLLVEDPVAASPAVVAAGEVLYEQLGLVGEPPEVASLPEKSCTETATANADYTVVLGACAEPAHAPRNLGFGRYRLQRLLGSGAYGSVFLAQDVQLERPVAIKMPRILEGVERHQQERIRERFRREVEVASKLHHPNICKVFDVGEAEGVPFAVLDYIEAGSLADRLRRGSPLEPRVAADLIRKVGAALEEVHKAGVVHRDLKPANILLTGGTEPLLTDFGLVPLERIPGQRSGEGAVLGTPGYMAPEQARGEPEQVGPWSDIYSLGVVLYELLAGDPTLREPPAREVDPYLFKVIRRATAPRPAERYRSAAEFADALDQFLLGGTPPTLLTPPPRRVRVYLRTLPRTGKNLFGRDSELEYLDAAWENCDRHNIVSLVAPGGAGKSALINRWIARLAPDQFRGAELVYGWSFYRHGSQEQTTSDQFMDHVLRWLDDPNPHAGSPEDKGYRLAAILAERRVLLILDGLELLQDPPRGECARIKDPALAALLTNLAANNRGLCVITTRYRVRDVENFAITTAPLVELQHLGAAAGAELLRSVGVYGPDDELCQASAEFGGHALALTLLGTYLQNFCDGDVRRRVEVRLLKGDEEAVDQARRVMESYERQYQGRAELAVLHLIGLFDRPADRGSILALRAEPPIPGLTDVLTDCTDAVWNQVVARLRAAKLLAEADREQPDVIDAHPLVRAYFGQRLREQFPASWREGHSRLYEHLRDLWQYDPRVPRLPDTAEGMKVLYAAVAHACHAGRPQEALDEVYWPRIQQGKQGVSTKKLGLFGEEITLFVGFFVSPWDQPVPAVSEFWQAHLLALVGSRLRALGRPAESLIPIEKSLQMHLRLGNLVWAAHEARHLSELCLMLGNLAQALVYADRGVELADRSDSGYERYAERAVRGSALRHLGRLEEARACFQEAEAILQGVYPDLSILYSLWGFRYGELLLDLGQYDEVLRRGEQMWRLREQGRTTIDPEAGLGPASAGWEDLILGQAGLYRAWGSGDPVPDAVQQLLDRALKVLRDAGRQDHMPVVLLTRAALRRHLGDCDGAEKDLQDALAVAARGRMRLHEADCQLESARLYLAKGMRHQARVNLARARMLIEQTEYHLRDAEVQELHRELAGGG